jgi:hypothetical protein
VTTAIATVTSGNRAGIYERVAPI